MPLQASDIIKDRILTIGFQGSCQVGATVLQEGSWGSNPKGGLQQGLESVAEKVCDMMFRLRLCNFCRDDTPLRHSAYL